MSFGYLNCAVDPLSAIEYGCLSEKNGFDRLWVPDHFVDVNGDRLEPWTVLSAVAVRTKKIRLGSGVADTQRSHPARTAHIVSSLDVISRGRAILGIGAGEAMNIVPFGLPWESPGERVTRLGEAIQVVRLLWTSSRERPVSFAGHYYRLENAFLSQPATQKPHPPIYVGAFASKAALQVVGRLGDGWFPWLNSGDTFRKRWSIVKEAAESAGRSPDLIEPCSMFMVAFPRNSAEKNDALIAGKANLIMERALLASLGQKEKIDQYQNLVSLSKEDIAKIMDAVEGVPDDFVYRTMAIGGISEVKEKVDELSRAGVRHLAIVDLLAPKTVERTLNLLRKIIRDYK